MASLSLRLKRLEELQIATLQLMAEGFIAMANDFSALQQAVSDLLAAVADVAQAIRNPGVDKNDQGVIDALAGRLEGAVTALAQATADENAEDAGQPLPSEQPPVVDVPPATDGTADGSAPAA